MAKMTLLEMVQDILSDMNSDNVNSITDTVESEQVAQILKTTYYELLSGKNWPFMRKLVSLDSSIQSPSPVHLHIPNNIKEILSIEYDVADFDKELNYRYEKLKYVEPDDFLRRSSALSKRDGVAFITDVSGSTFHALSNKKPEYYTSFDDKFLVFDSFDSSIESTLQGYKVRSLAYVTPSWEPSDDFIPDLAEEMFSALVAEAKSVSFLNILDYENKKAEQQAIRQRNRMSRNSWTVSGGIKLPSYGKR